MIKVKEKKKTGNEKNLAMQRKGRRKKKKKRLRYRGERVCTAGHHHPLPDLDH